MRAVGVVADRRPDACHLAGGDRGADTRAADKYTALGTAVLQRLAELACLVGIVDAHLVRVRAEIDHVVRGERVENRVAQVHTAVVEGGRDFHTRSSSAVARATTLSTL